MYKQSRCFMSFKVAGFGYHDGPLVFNELKIGDKLDIVPEFDNPYDHQAIALLYKGKKIGYVPRDRNDELSIFCACGYADIFEACIISLRPQEPVYKQVEVRISLKEKPKNQKHSKSKKHSTKKK